jgi:hypothetical protein
MSGQAKYFHLLAFSTAIAIYDIATTARSTALPPALTRPFTFPSIIRLTGTSTFVAQLQPFPSVRSLAQRPVWGQLSVGGMNFETP